MDKTFAAIEKLKEVELELHRLKNYAEMMNRSVEAQREWQGLTDEEILEEYRQSYGDDGNLTDVYFARAIEAKLKEKNA
jgi:hypothetical protein